MQKVATKRGDTIIEVMMAVAIFAIVAIMTVSLMNHGINVAQRTLEETMARNELDGQAEAISYIHTGYVSESRMDDSSNNFRALWKAITATANPADITDNAKFNINKLNSCSEAYQGSGQTGGMVRAYKAFALNTRLVLPDTNSNYGGEAYSTNLSDIVVGIDSIHANDLKPTLVYPRIVYKKADFNTDRSISSSSVSSTESGPLAEKSIYNKIGSAEGVYVIAVCDNNDSNCAKKSKYFDFYIRTCWHSVGSPAPSTISTIIRLYNPEAAI